MGRAMTGRHLSKEGARQRDADSGQKSAQQVGRYPSAADMSFLLKKKEV